ncbi:MAG TPA: STAS domain-containing protein [Pirellulaceae bacterium]|nr:STAS domain-containing protein [Pirellulaceae bacterium]
MWIKVEIINGVVRGSFTSTEVTGDEMIQQAGRELMDVVDAAAETKKLVLSFKGVEFMSSAMIGKLVLLNKKAKSRGVQIKFCDIGLNVLQVFIITRLNKEFRIIRRDDDNDDDDDGPGNAGVFAKLPKNPSSGGAHAKPPRDDR